METVLNLSSAVTEATGLGGGALVVLAVLTIVVVWMFARTYRRIRNRQKGRP